VNSKELAGCSMGLCPDVDVALGGTHSSAGTARGMRASEKPRAWTIVVATEMAQDESFSSLGQETTAIEVSRLVIPVERFRDMGFELSV